MLPPSFILPRARALRSPTPRTHAALHATEDCTASPAAEGHAASRCRPRLPSAATYFCITRAVNLHFNTVLHSNFYSFKGD